MMNENRAYDELQRQIHLQERIQEAIVEQFAAEDEGLHNALLAASAQGLPEIQISPLQGKMLQVLAASCNAQRILEIGSLGGYSGIWLARALPSNGRLVTLEISPKHAEAVRKAFVQAGVAERTEVRVGNALDLLPFFEQEAPFDLIFIDADKESYADYLEWALRLSRPGSIIVADNCIRGGRAFPQLDDENRAKSPTEEEELRLYKRGIREYNRRIQNDTRLVSLLLPMDDGYTDGFAISVVKHL